MKWRIAYLEKVGENEAKFLAMPAVGILNACRGNTGHENVDFFFHRMKPH